MHARELISSSTVQYRGFPLLWPICGQHVGHIKSASIEPHETRHMLATRSTPHVGHMWCVLCGPLQATLCGPHVAAYYGLPMFFEMFGGSNHGRTQRQKKFVHHGYHGHKLVIQLRAYNTRCYACVYAFNGSIQSIRFQLIYDSPIN
jgi:hypothetical protein